MPQFPRGVVSTVGTWSGYSGSTGHKPVDISAAAKSGSQNVTSSSFTDITDMTFGVSSGETWEFEFYISLSSGGTAYFSVNGPTASRLFFSANNDGNSLQKTMGVAYGDIVLQNGSGEDLSGLVIHGWVTFSASGTFALQGKTDASFTVSSNTFYIAKRIS